MGGFSERRLDRMRDVLSGYVAQEALPGLVTLVSRQGETRVETIGKMAYGGAPMQRDTIFRIASMTKPITAVAAMILVEECRLRLDDPIDRFLPEMADRRVLQNPNGSLEETVPAERAITLRDLLTLRIGLGYLMTPDTPPIMQAANERGILKGPPHPRSLPNADEWIRRVGELPLMFQPGQKWQYDLGMDVLGALIGRAAGRPFEAFLKERIFDPLGMKDTGFFVPESEIGRLATSYSEGKVYDESAGGEWSHPPKFALGSGGLVSTADDYLAFAQMLLSGGAPLLARPTVELMTSDQLAPEHKNGSELFFGTNKSWGFGMGVYIHRDEIGATPGRFGWDGGLGTSAYTDPKEQMIGILMTQQAWTSPEGPLIWNDFWTLAYAAIED